MVNNNLNTTFYSKAVWFNHFEISRQSYYQYKSRIEKVVLEEDIILELLREQKRLLPNSGGRKMYYLIKPMLQQMNIKCGRDRVFQLLGENGLLVQRKKNKTITTRSNHHYYIYTNLIKSVTIDRIMQIWVTDITYIRTLEGFMYLALITDAFSRKIVGWDISKSLELEGCLRALQKAIRPISKKMLKVYPLIHHSDRGSQYCSKIYTQMLHNKNIKISMAATGNCYENALAERVNGILKMEFELDQNFASAKAAISTTKDAIHKYNYLRPHMALEYATPASVFDHNFKELQINK